MRITELFDRKYEWNWYEKNEMTFGARFETHDARNYRVTFYSIVNRFSNAERWILEFVAVQPFGTHSTNITHTGDQYKIFTTVIDIINYFKKYHPEAEIEFTASEHSRQKLYARMVNTLTKKYDYTFVGRYTTRELGDKFVIK